MRRTTITVTLVAVFCFVVVGTPVLARGSITTGQAAALAQDGNRAGTSEEAGAKLDSVKLKLCMNRENLINNIMSRIANRGQKRLNVYSKIAARVEDFYTKKGKTLSNYDSLVADVNAKKTDAQAAIDQIKADKADFKCDGTDPKGIASSFKADLKLELKALHDYQQSIKNLIVGVKSVQSVSTSNGSDSEGGGQ